VLLNLNEMQRMALSLPPALFIPGLGMGELALVLVLVLLLFGPGKLPQVAQSLGEAVNRFRRGASSEEKHLPENPSSASNTKTPQADAPPKDAP
jgi:sec-independent protein translocase protein TatA